MSIGNSFKIAWSCLLLLVVVAIGVFIAKSVTLSQRVLDDLDGSGTAITAIIITTSVACVIEGLFITMLIRGVKEMKRQAPGAFPCRDE